MFQRNTLILCTALLFGGALYFLSSLFASPVVGEAWDEAPVRQRDVALARGRNTARVATPKAKQGVAPKGARRTADRPRRLHTSDVGHRIPSGRETAPTAKRTPDATTQQPAASPATPPSVKKIAPKTLPLVPGTPLPRARAKNGKLPVGDLSEIAPSWWRPNSPGEDRRYAPRAANDPMPPIPPGVIQKKDETRITLHLVITTDISGVALKVNGHRVGTAPVALDIEIPKPGNLRIEASKDGHARVIQDMRLGADHPGGRLEVDLLVPVDAPAAIPTTPAPPVESTEETR